MKIKKTLYLTLLILLLISMIYFCKGADSQSTELTFQYKGKDYNINVGELAAKNNLNINNYGCYVIGIDYGTKDIIICYSNSLMSITGKNSGYYSVSKGGNGFLIKIKTSGAMEVWNPWGSYTIKIGFNDFIASNQNLYYGTTKIFSKNQGYEYDPTNEKDKECNDIVKTIKSTAVYESAAMNYAKIETLSSGVIIKRINKEVNEANGHLWDKVLLRDGTEGYVFSDNLEIIEDYTNIHFKYNEKKYNIYFSPTKYEKNMEDYPYYFVGKEYATNDILIVYSNTRISAKGRNTLCDEFSKNDNGFLIRLKSNRSNTS